MRINGNYRFKVLKAFRQWKRVVIYKAPKWYVTWDFSSNIVLIIQSCLRGELGGQSTDLRINYSPSDKQWFYTAPSGFLKTIIHSLVYVVGGGAVVTWWFEHLACSLQPLGLNLIKITVGFGRSSRPWLLLSSVEKALYCCQHCKEPFRAPTEKYRYRVFTWNQSCRCEVSEHECYLMSLFELLRTN